MSDILFDKHGVLRFRALTLSDVPDNPFDIKVEVFYSQQVSTSPNDPSATHFVIESIGGTELIAYEGRYMDGGRYVPLSRRALSVEELEEVMGMLHELLSYNITHSNPFEKDILEDRRKTLLTKVKRALDLNLEFGVPKRGTV